MSMYRSGTGKPILKFSGLRQRTAEWIEGYTCVVNPPVCVQQIRAAMQLHPTGTDSYSRSAYRVPLCAVQSRDLVIGVLGHSGRLVVDRKSNWIAYACTALAALLDDADARLLAASRPQGQLGARSLPRKSVGQPSRLRVSRS